MKCLTNYLLQQVKLHLFVVRFILILCINALITTAAFAQNNTQNYCAYSYYSQPKYAANFKNFEYVNVNAPKKGRLLLPAQGFFNGFNPFSLKGEAAPGLDVLFDGLMAGSQDEEATLYCLIASSIKVDALKKHIQLTLNAKAKFNNGDTITPKDVATSIWLLKNYGTPALRFQLDQLQTLSYTNTTIHFTLKQFNKDSVALITGLPIFSLKWYLAMPQFEKNQSILYQQLADTGSDLTLSTFFKKINFTQTSFDALDWQLPISSGPYQIANYKPGKFIEYQLNENYWAKQHPTKLGMFNFKQLRYDIFKDDLVKLEAFKAGKLDANIEYRAKSWNKAYQGPLFENGSLKKQLFKHQNPTGLQGFILNTKRPFLQDVRVRHALNLVLDFNWLNQALFYNQYQPLNSYFSNSQFSSVDFPLTINHTQALQKLGFTKQEIDELFKNQQQLNQYQKQLNLPFRQRLILAKQLLQQAGWQYQAKKQALVHAKYGVFSLTLYDSGGAMSRVAQMYGNQLKKLGIELNYILLDGVILRKKIEQYDFDMITTTYGSGLLPGEELQDRFSSKTLGLKGGSNYAGVNVVNVDKLLLKLPTLTNKADLTLAVRTLDMLLLNQHYVIPHWYSQVHRIAFKKGLAYPKPPLYYSAEDWLISQWWDNK